jgi:hypothetical protein
MKQYYTYLKLDIEWNISDFIFKEKINDFILPKHVYPMCCLQIYYHNIDLMLRM